MFFNHYVYKHVSNAPVYLCVYIYMLIYTRKRKGKTESKRQSSMEYLFIFGLDIVLVLRRSACQSEISQEFH